MQTAEDLTKNWVKQLEGAAAYIGFMITSIS